MRLHMFFNGFFLFCFVALSLDLRSQSDTLFVRFPNTANESTYEIIRLNEGYGVLNHNAGFEDIENYPSLYITDFDGNITARLDTIRINNMQIEIIQSMIAIGDGIVLLANAKLDSSTDVFVSIRLDLNLENLQVVDTFYLDKDQDIIFIENFKQFGDIAEGFGVIQNAVNNAFVNNIYIQITAAGKFSQIEPVSLIDHPTFVMDFARMTNLSSYFITFWNNTSIVVDYNFNLLKSMVNEFTYKIGDTTFHDEFTFYGIDYNGDKLVGAGSGISRNSYDLSLADIKYEGDSFKINSIYPILPPGTRKDIVTASLTIDSDGNYIVAGVDFFNPFSSAINPNTLYVTKLTSDFNLVWYLTYKSDKKMQIHDMITDPFGDVAVIGSYWHHDFPGHYQGFLLKVLHDGSITATKDPWHDEDELIKIYPCPAHDEFFVESKSKRVISGTIFSVNGNLIKTFQLKNEIEKLDISELPAGSYYVRLSDIRRNTVITGAFIKL